MANFGAIGIGLVVAAGVAASAAYALAPDAVMDSVRRAAAAVGAGQVAGAGQGAATGARPAMVAKAPVVRTVTPQPSKEVQTIMLPGRTAPIEQAQIAARVSGYVAERFVDIGETVADGQVLLVIDAPEVDHQIARAKAAVEQAVAQRRLAEASAGRSQSLVQTGIVSKQVQDERMTAVNAATADQAAAEAEVRRLDEVRKFLTVRAPFAGVVVGRFIDRGDRVSSGEGQAGSALFRIARLEQLRVEIDVPQSAAMRVVAGNAARITFAELPGQVFEAKVARITNVIDPASATMRAELAMDNPGRRIPAGLTGQVNLDLSSGQPVVTVPTNTLAVRGGRQVVTVVDGQSRIKFVPVTLGRDLGNRIEVTAGLAATDRVVLSPNALLREGDQVEVATPAPTT
ncbi:MAG: efflux RND transporter periplasmic adaptor subunit [Hyphomicrobiaceae bacterium]|nr:efflux RND transporter periplasmic adaptor subunit [Hyphomicrobiaceae bacterium]